MASQSCRPADANAFTLIELLVVIAILSILLAVMIPAIGSVREAARRTSCSNHLKQVALGVAAYRSAHSDTFPTGRFVAGAGANSRSWSWLANILPYVDEADVYIVGKIPRSTLRESGATRRTIDVFLCPSDGTADVRTDAGNLDGLAVGPTNYKAVSGANWGADRSQQLNEIGTKWRNLGRNGSYDGLESVDGLMGRNDEGRPRRESHVRDGFTHTLMIGEDLPVKNRWCSWPYSNNAYGTCAIPPNVSGNSIHYNPLWWPNTWSFRSSHPGAVQFSFADGAVRPIADQIELQTYRDLATIAGQENLPTDF